MKLQGMELGLRALAAAGALMLGTVQCGKAANTRFEPARDDSGAMTEPEAFDQFLGRVRKEGGGLVRDHVKRTACFPSLPPLVLPIRCN
jgi:hypothetical protein